ncbi:MAG: tRNA lysidine(34) synthetase TilS, partial [Aquificota bacterium]
MNVEKSFLKTIKEFNLIQPKDKILVAYSTGVDSSVLTYLLLKFKNYLKIDEIVLAYLNHKIRPESDKEEEFAINFAKSLNIEIYTKKVDVKRIANELKKSVEQVGREERYKFFKQISQEKGLNKIATGHHLSDLAETMTLWFIQGNKNGLKGFRPREKNVIRPLYLIKKEEIYKYAKEKDINFNEDYTNYSLDYMRNKIRHEIIPKIKEINPSFEKSMLNLSYFLNIDECYFKEFLLNFNFDTDFIDIKQFKNDALFYRIIDDWVYRKTMCKLSYQQIKDIIKLKDKKGSKKIKICDNYL